MIDISVLIPLYNEEEIAKELLRRLTMVLNTLRPKNTFEIILVDDGSVDNTRSILEEEARKNKNIKLLLFSRNFGHQAAISAAIDHASGEVVIAMDGDLQDPPELIPDFLTKYMEGYDVVYAVRQKRKESRWKRLAYFLYYRIHNMLTGKVKFPVDAGDFALMSKKIVKELQAMPEKNRYIRGLRSWVGFRQTGLMYERDKRYAGKPKYNLWKLIKLAYDGIFSFSYAPLTLVTFLGFTFSLTSFLGVIIVLILKFFTNSYIPGFASTAVITLFIGGIQLLSIGVLGEYIRRIYDEVKGRPLYIVEKMINFERRIDQSQKSQ